MSKLIVFSLLLTGCIFNHPQYCRSDDDCLMGQRCPVVRTPEQPPAICKGKAIVTHTILAD